MHQKQNVFQFCGEEQEQIQKINKIVTKQNTVVIGFQEHQRAIHTECFISLGKRTSLEEISKNLFTSLRKADKQKADLILIEGIKAEGLGLAIMNRLIRTCDYHVI